MRLSQFPSHVDWTLLVRGIIPQIRHRESSPLPLCLQADGRLLRVPLSFLSPIHKRSLSPILLLSSGLDLVQKAIMTAVAKRRLAALSEQLVSPVPDQGNFENIPKLKKIAPDSNGPRVKGKVVIVTGKFILSNRSHIPCTDPTCRNQFSSWYWTSVSTSIRAEWCKSGVHMRLQRLQPRDT